MLESFDSHRNSNFLFKLFTFFSVWILIALIDSVHRDYYVAWFSKRSKIVTVETKRFILI